MKIIFSTTIFLSVLFSNNVLFSQIGVGYFGGDMNKIAVNIDFHDKVWTSLRYSSEYPLEDGYEFLLRNDRTSEIMLGIDIHEREYLDIYIGLGWMMEWDYFNYGFGIPIGVKIMPFEKLKSFAFKIESAFYVDNYVEFDWLNTWGISIDF